jgi:hypothetical protein
MIETQLSTYLWMELAKITDYLKNRSSIKLLLYTIPWESFYKEKSDLSNFRIIGLLVYYYNVEIETGLNRRIKSDPRNRQIKLIGYSKGFSQYRVWNSINNKVEEITFIRINESDYMVILEELGEQEMILSLFNESEDFLSNNEMIEISISLINFNKNKYQLFFIFIYQCLNILALTEINELNINKEFINLKQRFLWTLQDALQSPEINEWLKIM